MKYRKKPIIVEAYQTDVELDIETLEGIMHASIGDYIITGVNGEKYPCKPNVFEKTYELVEENNYKMSKALEALEIWGKNKGNFNPKIGHNEDIICIHISRKDYRTIESALKEHESMKQTKFIVADKKISDEDLEKLKNQRMFISNLEESKIEPFLDEKTQKKLKALEIIKSKITDISFRYGGKMGNVIKLQIGCDTCYLHFDENDKNFDLLKEVLL